MIRWDSKHLGIWLALAVEVLLLTILTSSIGGEAIFQSTFLSWSNLSQVVKALSFIAIMAVGQSLVIITGGVDLSIGSLLGLSGVVTAVLLNDNFGIISASCIGILVGVGGGVVNGVIITKAKLPPFIATLGMMSIARGLAFALTGGETIRNLQQDFQDFFPQRPQRIRPRLLGPPRIRLRRCKLSKSMV